MIRIDPAFFATRRYSIADVAGLFQIPPSLIAAQYPAEPVVAVAGDLDPVPFAPVELPPVTRLRMTPDGPLVEIV